MSDNPFRLTVTFKDQPSAEKVTAILRAAKEWIWEGFNDEGSNEERFIGQYITNADQTEGVQFTSYWVPNELNLDGNVLTFEFVGSPGDDWPDDIVVWFRQAEREQRQRYLVDRSNGRSHRDRRILLARPLFRPHERRAIERLTIRTSHRRADGTVLGNHQRRLTATRALELKIHIAVAVETAET